MKRILTFVVFLILNFSALWIGQIFTGGGVVSDWYKNVNTAPWTPPGWVFGVAWTSIMITYAWWLQVVWKKQKNPTWFISAYALQWVLNVSWNPFFFYWHETAWALFILTLLWIVVGFSMIRFRNGLGLHALWILPYAIWLGIAFSLNAYIVWFN
jgi:benzodiazapine receptor